MLINPPFVEVTDRAKAAMGRLPECRDVPPPDPGRRVPVATFTYCTRWADPEGNLRSIGPRYLPSLRTLGEVTSATSFAVTTGLSVLVVVPAPAFGPGQRYRLDHNGREFALVEL